jgi:hypothetical protein
MSVTISIEPTENGTAIVTLTPKDEATPPRELAFEELINPAWQLTLSDGTIVNERSFENCPLTALQFVISGADLQDIEGQSRKRILGIQFWYNSTVGLNLPCTDEASFNIRKLVTQVPS